MIKERDFRTLSGTSVSAYDPQRGIWYGMCTFWTDDWSKVDTSRQIPVCPYCGSPGMQTNARDWFDGAAQFQTKCNPGYVNFLNQSKEQCQRPLTFMEWFKQWLTEHPNGKETNPRSNGT